MNENRDTQLPALVPDRPYARIIHVDALAFTIPGGCAQVLVYLQAVRAQLNILFQLFHCSLRPLGVVDVGEVDIRKNNKLNVVFG